MKQRGLFITIEGSDGSGKSTQLANIKKYFEEKKIPVVFSREPGGTPIGEKIRTIILDKKNAEMCDMTEVLLYAASRAQHVQEKILPSLEAGINFVSDRFVDSSMAYQGYGRGLREAVMVINSYAIGDCMPDYTFFLNLDPVVGKNRIKSDEFDRLEKEKNDFHLRVYDGYKEMFDEDRFIVIDASGSIEEVKLLIYEKLDEIFGVKDESIK